MDMKTVAETIKSYKKYDHDKYETLWLFLGELVNEDALSQSEVTQLFKLVDIPTNCAEFLAKWYPEYVGYAIDNLRYDITFEWCGVYTEEQFAQELNRLECTEDEFNEDYGMTIRDNSFEGVCVFGG